MTFSIITPSFDQPDWLRLCLASVADQAGVSVEHIVQDNNSGGAVGRVAAEFPGARWVREADAGMYDAVNRGMGRATGDICGYLNCDEQYLPGALAAVGEVFERHPEVDLVTGDGVVMDAGGRLLAARRGVRLRAAGIEGRGTPVAREPVDRDPAVPSMPDRDEDPGENGRRLLPGRARGVVSYLSSGRGSDPKPGRRPLARLGLAEGRMSNSMA